jgi:hypothetical protein
MGGIAVRGEAVANKSTLRLREKPGCLGVVVDKPVGCNRHHNRGYTFLLSR